MILAYSFLIANLIVSNCSGLGSQKLKSTIAFTTAHPQTLLQTKFASPLFHRKYNPTNIENIENGREIKKFQRVHSLEMIGYGGRRDRGQALGFQGNSNEEVAVQIEKPASNVRRISGSVLVNKPIEYCWRILSDYDNLCTYVPNLVQSKLVNHPQGGIRLFQEGAQKIFGFNFRASLTMDMTEYYGTTTGGSQIGMTRRIGFELVDSAMFGDFSGEWRMQSYSRKKSAAGKGVDGGYEYATRLFYFVTIRPKGPVPVGALEWRIKEDVPINMMAVKRSAESLPFTQEYLDRLRLEQEAGASKWYTQSDLGGPSISYEEEETLSAYLAARGSSA